MAETSVSSPWGPVTSSTICTCTTGELAQVAGTAMVPLVAAMLESCCSRRHSVVAGEEGSPLKARDLNEIWETAKVLGSVQEKVLLPPRVRAERLELVMPVNWMPSVVLALL